MGIDSLRKRSRRALACISAVLVTAGAALQVSAGSDSALPPGALVFVGAGDLEDPSFEGRPLVYRFAIQNLSAEPAPPFVIGPGVR